MFEMQIVELADRLLLRVGIKDEEQRMLAVIVFQLLHINTRCNRLDEASVVHTERSKAHAALGLRRTVNQDVNRAGRALGRKVEHELQPRLAEGLAEVIVLVAHHRACRVVDHGATVHLGGIDVLPAVVLVAHDSRMRPRVMYVGIVLRPCNVRWDSSA